MSAEDKQRRGGRAAKAKARYPLRYMRSAKETVRQILDELPDSASLEDIQYHIYVREKVERGLRDVEAGRVVDQDEAKRRMAKWLGESRLSDERRFVMLALAR